MADTVAVPVTLEQFNRLKSAQRRLSNVLTLVDKMENCGMPCDVIREGAKNAITQMQNVEREFFTPPPEV